jgi:hypothetical protein
MPVDTKNKQYVDNQKIWKKCRDAVEGQEAIHKGSVEYLPKLSGQSTTEYVSYRDRALFYNASQRTVDAMSGLLFRKSANVVIPTPLEPWLDNIDMQGNSLQTFTENLADEVLVVGRVGVLVEHSVKTEDVRTIADAERNGLRPFLTSYRAEDIINWNQTTLNGVKVLNLVVLREYHSVQGEDEFTWQTVEKYRVLDLVEGVYRQRVFVKDRNANFTLESEIVPRVRGNAFNYIPFIIISGKDADFSVIKPPILDLVNVNLSHYKTMADLEHGAHFTGLPTPIITGHNLGEDETFSIGSTTAWVLPNEETDVKYLEFTGQGLGALESRLVSKERQMATLGARLLVEEKAAVEAAETHNIKRQGENSALSSVAESISSGMTDALSILVEWSGVSSNDVEYKINKDFIPGTMDASTMVALLQIWQSGGMSFAEFIRNLQQGEIVNAEKSVEDIRQEIETDGPVGLAIGDIENE